MKQPTVTVVQSYQDKSVPNSRRGNVSNFISDFVIEEEEPQESSRDNINLLDMQPCDNLLQTHD